MQVLMLAGNYDSLLSKHDAPVSSIIVEDFLRVPLTADFLDRLNSDTAHTSLHENDANPKIEINILQFKLQKGKVSILY